MKDKSHADIISKFPFPCPREFLIPSSWPLSEHGFHNTIQFPKQQLYASGGFYGNGSSFFEAHSLFWNLSPREGTALLPVGSPWELHLSVGRIAQFVPEESSTSS